jgi:hypothetical protein
MDVIKTPRGKFTIQEKFSDSTEAKNNGYTYYFTHGNTDIYTKHKDIYHCKFGVVERRNING